MAIAHLGRRSSELMGTHHRTRLRISTDLMMWTAALLGGHAVAQDPPFRPYTVTEGLPSNTVYSAFQDRDGYLWFGTDAGASRFDGRHFVNYTTSDGLGDNEVMGMFQDSKGRIWFRALNSKHSFHQGGRIYSSREYPALSKIKTGSGCLSIEEDNKGTLWFTGIAGGLYGLRDSTVIDLTAATHPMASGLRGSCKLLRRGPDELLVMAGSSIFRLEGEQLIYERQWDAGPLGLPAAQVQQGKIIAHGNTGILQVGRNSDSTLVEMGTQLTADAGRTPTLSRDGMLWLPLTMGGVQRTALDRKGYGGTARAFQQFNINTVLEDAEGNIWLSTDGNGAVCIGAQQRAFGLIDPSGGGLQRAVTAIVVTRQGLVFFGTARGTVHQLTAHGVVEVVPQPVPRSLRDRVRDLKEAEDGSIWFCTDTWVGSFDPERINSTTGPLTARDDRETHPIVFKAQLKALAPGLNGRMLGSYFGVAELVPGNNGLLFEFRGTYMMDRLRVYAPFISKDGALWFETDQRLHNWRDGQRRDFPGLDGYFGSRISDIDELSDGTLVIASAGGGVHLVHDGRLLRSFGTLDGLCSEQCRAAVVHNDTLLVATDKGVCVITDPAGATTMRTWTEAQGLPSLDVQDVDLVHNTLLLATPLGLCTVPLAVPATTAPPPLLRFSNMSSNGTALAIGDHVRIPLGAPLELQLHAVTYSQPGSTRFALRSAPDSAWRELPSAEVLISASVPGTHQYSVRARTPFSDWCAPLPLTVVVVPPWYRTTWAGLVFFLCAIGGIALLVRGAMRIAVRRQAEELERAKALTEERQRIAADMHDDLGADISHLLMLARHGAGNPALNLEERKSLSIIEAHASSMMQKIDEVIWSLDPADDRLLAALEFLQRFAENFAAQHGMDFRTKPISGIVDQPMPGKHRRELYLLLKELLMNIAKHTTARHLRFEVHASTEQLVIIVEDDGHPKDRNTGSRNGHGLSNIRTRLVHLHGELSSEPLLPHGTRLSITLWKRWIHQL